MACVFCTQVINNEESLTISKDDDVVIFLDKYPRTKGHVCIAPTGHYQTIFETPLEVAKKVMAVVADFSNALKEYGAKGINVGINIGKVAGQQVSHFHVHMIPRYEMDDAIEIEPAFTNTPWRHKSLELGEEEMRTICNDLSDIFSAYKQRVEQGE